MAEVVLRECRQDLRPLQAVNNVSLTVERRRVRRAGRAVGCGKTTTLNLVAGLIPITSGDIVIGDRVVNNLDPKDRDIAMVFQNYALYPQKSVYQEPRLPAANAQAPKRGDRAESARGGQGAGHRRTCSSESRASCRADSSNA